jgi:hypothetical protein
LRYFLEEWIGAGFDPAVFFKGGFAQNSMDVPQA